MCEAAASVSSVRSCRLLFAVNFAEEVSGLFLRELALEYAKLGEVAKLLCCVGDCCYYYYYYYDNFCCYSFSVIEELFETFCWCT